MSESKNKVKLQNVVLGSGRLALIVPIIPKDRKSLIEMAKEALVSQPTILEWRIDHYDTLEDLDEVAAALEELRACIGSTALLVTPRHEEENGVRHIQDDIKFALLKRIIESGDADMVDIELRYGADYIGKLKDLCKANNCALMVSYHDLEETPADEELLAKLQDEVDVGADVCKVSFVANTYTDIDRLGKLVLHAKETVIPTPIVSVSAGAIGMFARVAADCFGSDGTFASCGETYQIHIDDLRTLRRTLHLPPEA